MKKPLVSVIIPVYQTEGYLERCIASAAGQTCRDLEILLVDDGSTDASPEICDAWAEKDARIRVIHQENRGLGMARNSGLDRAAGSFLCFLDSDDALEETALEKAVALAEETAAEVVLYGMTCLRSDGTVTARRCPGMGQVFEGSQVQEMLLPKLISGEEGLTMSACCCLFSGALLRKLHWRFPSEREIISEDVYALLDLFAFVRRAAVLPEAPYRYYENTGSLSRSYRPDRLEKNVYFYNACLELCRRRGYGREIQSRCGEPFLSFTVAAMKQAAACLGRAALPELRALCLDEALARALRETGGNPGWKRRLLYFFLKRRRVWSVYLLLRAQNRMQ